MRSPILFAASNARRSRSRIALKCLRPGEDLNCKIVIGPGLKSLQSAFLDQVIAELTEARPGLIVAEARAGNRAKPFKMGARTVTIAVLETQIDGSADDQGMQVEICKECSRPELGEHIERCKGRWGTHQGQIDEFLDRAAADLRPDPLVFAPCFLFGRVRRPVNAEMPEIVETDGDGTVALIEGHVQICPQAGDCGSFYHRCGAA